MSGYLDISVIILDKLNQVSYILNIQAYFYRGDYEATSKN